MNLAIKIKRFLRAIQSHKGRNTFHLYKNHYTPKSRKSGRYMTNKFAWGSESSLIFGMTHPKTAFFHPHHHHHHHYPCAYFYICNYSLGAIIATNSYIQSNTSATQSTYLFMPSSTIGQMINILTHKFGHCYKTQKDLCYMQKSQLSLYSTVSRIGKQSFMCLCECQSLFCS
jgi:hypothetical protein